MYPDKFLNKTSEITDDFTHLVLYNDSYSTDDGYSGNKYTTHAFISTIGFKSLEKALEWIQSEVMPKQWGSGKDPKDFLIIPVEAIRRVEVETKITAKIK